MQKKAYERPVLVKSKVLLQEVAAASISNSKV